MLPLERLAEALLVVAFFALRSALSAKPTKWIPSFAGPYHVYVDQLLMCDPNTMDKSVGHFEIHVRMSHWNPMRPSDEQIVNGWMELVNATIDDDKWFVVKLAIRSNNQWKDNAFVFRSPGGGCSFMRANLPGFWRGVFDQDPKQSGKCEVTRGKIVLRNRTIGMRVPNFPILPYGHYRAVGHGGVYGREHLPPGLCFFAELHIVPRPT